MKVVKGASQYLSSKLLGHPYFCHFYVTSRCDLKCKQCTVPEDFKKIDVQNRGELSLREVAQMADQLKQLKISNILLTGGEPFARKDLAEIVKILAGRGFSVRIVTNGASFVGQNRLQQILDAGIDALQVSFDSLNPDIHDDIAGVKGTWEKANSTLAYASSNLKGGMVCAITVVSSLNIHELPDIAKYITSLGAYSIFQPVHLSSDEGEAGVLGMSDCTEMSIKNQQGALVVKIYDELIRMKKKGYNILSSDRFLKDSVAFFTKKKRNWACDAIKYYITICPHGEVLPCMRYEDCSWLERLNILEGNFILKFKSKKLQEDAKRYRRACPGCVYSCYREMSYLFHQPDVVWDMGTMFVKKTLRDMLKKNTMHKGRLE